MKYQTKRQLRMQISELQARIYVYEMALANAGLSTLGVLQSEEPKPEMGFVSRKSQ